MNFGHFFNQTLGPMGFDITPNRYHAYQGEFDAENGWDLWLDHVEFTPKTLAVVHFPDFVKMNGSRVVELEKVEQFYGTNSNQVLVTYWTSDMDRYYTGPLNLIKFSNHNYDMCNALAQGFDQWKDILGKPRTHAWQCLNGRLTPHRYQVAYTLKNWHNGWLSLGQEIPLPEWDYSRYFGCDNFPNFLALKYVYGSAAVNVVTETQYTEATGIVTEKTLLAMAAEQIPIVIGHQGIVDQCRRMGFDMFDDLVDNSYDIMPNESRAEMALHLNQDVICGKIDLEPYRDRLERQREYVLWGLPDRMEREFVTQARALADRLLPTYTP